MTTVFVPGDSGAASVGADAVAAAIAQRAPVVRTGSRGAYFLEPMIEVEVGGRRLGYGPVAAEDVPSLFAGGFQAGGDHPLALGPVDAIPFLRGQTRVTFARCGVVDPRSPGAHLAHGGLRGLVRAREIGAQAVIAEIAASGLRGRGGAGFPAAVKWRTVAAGAGPRFVVCNADEGDSGSFADRMLIEGDPFLLLEGMAIAGLTVGAAGGIVYLRSEYPAARRVLAEAIAAAEPLLGGFRVTIRVGAGSYVCGEESALLESLEGRRGVVRPRPPLPAVAGLFGRPTLIHNVLTLAAVPGILAQGGARWAELGEGPSRGTQAFQLSGALRRPGLVELPFGVTLGELLEGIGGGARAGRRLRAAQVGGPLGAWFPPALFGTRLTWEGMAEAGGMLGHGGVVAVDDRTRMGDMARFAMRFCAAESCGKCAPCRIGSIRAGELLDGLLAGDATCRPPLDAVCETMREASACGLGAMAPLPVQSVLRHFPEEFPPCAP